MANGEYDGESEVWKTAKRIGNIVDRVIRRFKDDAAELRDALKDLNELRKEAGQDEEEDGDQKEDAPGPSQES